MPVTGLCVSSLVSNHMKAFVLYLWIFFFQLFHIFPLSFIFLSVISVLSLYVTNMLPCFGHAFINCSLESYACTFFHYLHNIYYFFSVSVFELKTIFIFSTLIFCPLVFFLSVIGKCYVRLLFFPGSI